MSATSVDQRKQERLARLILSAPVSGVVPRAEQQGPEPEMDDWAKVFSFFNRELSS